MYQHTAGSSPVRYLRRVDGMALEWPTLFCLWTAGARCLLRHDPQLPCGRYRFSNHRAAARRGLLPSWVSLHVAMPRYLRRSYHPSQESSLSRAVEYRAVSRAARPATGPAGGAAASWRPRTRTR